MAAQSSPASVARRSAVSIRPRKRLLAERSASSGSTRSLRATLTAANRTSPTSWKSPSRPSAGAGRPAPAAPPGGRGRAGLGVLAGGDDGLGQLGELGLGARERALDAGEVEPARRGPALHLARLEERGEVLGDVAEDAALAAGLGALDLVPVAQDLAGRLGRRVAEDVRVAADELRAAALGAARH